MEMTSWLSEMGIDDSSFFNQYQMDYSDDLNLEQLAAAYGQDIQQTYSSESFSSHSNFNPSSFKQEESTKSCLERPSKQPKTSTDSWNSCTMERAFTPEGSSSPTMLSFGNSSSPTSQPQFHRNSSVCVNKPKEEVNSSTKKRGYVASSTTAQDHIIAERKRREKLSQRFIALSALIPGLKKMDKASVLEDSIKHIKELQERVKTLEVEKSTMESGVYVKQYQIRSEDDSSTDEISHEPLPEIQAKVSNKSVLIKVHCENQKGVMAKVLAEIEKLNLNVANSSFIAFGTSTLDITVLTQMGEGYDMKIVDLVKVLRSAIRKFM